MARSTIEKHTHKLKRIRFKTGNAVFFCALPDCHYKINQALALGKRNICWRCGDEFIMNEYSLRLAKPHCDSCHRPKGFIDKQPSLTVATSEQLQMNGIEGAGLSLADRLTSVIKRANEEGEEDI